MSREDNKYTHISDIKRNYRRMEEELVAQLNYEMNNHHAILLCMP